MNIFSNKTNVITYTVNKVDTSNLYISVQNGEVVINAPWYTTSSQIQQIVEEKTQWIINKINEYEKIGNKKKEYTKLKEVKVLGNNYDLAIRYKAVKVPDLSINERKINVTLPNKYKRLQNNEIVKILIEKMYEMITKKEIEKIMEKVRIMMQIAPEDYNIKKMENVLAKCEKNEIIINPNIAMYSREIIEYIIIHEFCHLKYKNHTQSFYNMIKTYMPNYENYVKEINKWKY